jgi:antitoxin component YwqK of YwqJK toxin-antitoxin module
MKTTAISSMKFDKHLARYAIIFCSIALWNNCDRPSTRQPPEQDTEAQPGIVREFSDTPGLSAVEIRNATDRVVTTGYYLNGLKESSWIEYSPGNRIIATSTSYVHGKKEGVFLEFNPATQQLVRQSFFHNDLRHGDYMEFNGSIIKEIRHYENGKLEGVSMLYYDTGITMEEGHYKNGLRDGVSRWYDQRGNMTIQYEYKNGQLVKK